MEDRIDEMNEKQRESLLRYAKNNDYEEAYSTAVQWLSDAEVPIRGIFEAVALAERNGFSGPPGKAVRLWATVANRALERRDMSCAAAAIDRAMRTMPSFPAQENWPTGSPATPELLDNDRSLPSLESLPDGIHLLEALAQSPGDFSRASCLWFGGDEKEKEDKEKGGRELWPALWARAVKAGVRRSSLTGTIAVAQLAEAVASSVLPWMAAATPNSAAAETYVRPTVALILAARDVVCKDTSQADVAAVNRTKAAAFLVEAVGSYICGDSSTGSQKLLEAASLPSPIIERVAGSLLPLSLAPLFAIERLGARVAAIVSGSDASAAVQWAAKLRSLSSTKKSSSSSSSSVILEECLRNFRCFQLMARLRSLQSSQASQSRLDEMEKKLDMHLEAACIASRSIGPDEPLHWLLRSAGAPVAAWEWDLCVPSEQRMMLRVELALQLTTSDGPACAMQLFQRIFSQLRAEPDLLVREASGMLGAAAQCLLAAESQLKPESTTERAWLQNAAAWYNLGALLGNASRFSAAAAFLGRAYAQFLRLVREKRIAAAAANLPLRVRFLAQCLSRCGARVEARWAYRSFLLHSLFSSVDSTSDISGEVLAIRKWVELYVEENEDEEDAVNEEIENNDEKDEKKTINHGQEQVGEEGSSCTDDCMERIEENCYNDFWKWGVRCHWLGSEISADAQPPSSHREGKKFRKRRNWIRKEIVNEEDTEGEVRTEATMDEDSLTLGQWLESEAAAPPERLIPLVLEELKTARGGRGLRAEKYAYRCLLHLAQLSGSDDEWKSLLEAEGLAAMARVQASIGDMESMALSLGEAASRHEQRCADRATRVGERVFSYLRIAALRYQLGDEAAFEEWAGQAAQSVRSRTKLALRPEREALDTFAHVQTCIDVALFTGRVDLASSLIKLGLQAVEASVAPLDSSLGSSMAAYLLAQSGALDLHDLGKWTAGLRCFRRVVEFFDQITSPGTESTTESSVYVPYPVAMFLALALRTMLYATMAVGGPGSADWAPWDEDSLLEAGEQCAVGVLERFQRVLILASSSSAASSLTCGESQRMATLRRQMEQELGALRALSRGELARGLWHAQLAAALAAQPFEVEGAARDLAFLSTLRALSFEIEGLQSLAGWWLHAGAAPEALYILRRVLDIVLELGGPSRQAHRVLGSLALAAWRSGQVESVYRPVATQVLETWPEWDPAVALEHGYMEAVLLEKAGDPISAAKAWKELLSVRMKRFVDEFYGGDKPGLLRMAGSVVPRRDLQNEIVARYLLASSHAGSSPPNVEELLRPGVSRGCISSLRALLALSESSNLSSTMSGSSASKVISHSRRGMLSNSSHISNSTKGASSGWAKELVRNGLEARSQLGGCRGIKTAGMAVVRIWEEDWRWASRGLAARMGVSARHRLALRKVREFGQFEEESEKRVIDLEESGDMASRGDRIDEKFVQGLDPLWTLVALAASEDRRRLTLARVERGYDRPVVLEVEAPGMGKLLAKLGDILDGSQRSLSVERVAAVTQCPASERNARRKQWWDERRELDEQLGKLLGQIQSELGPLRLLLLPSPESVINAQSEIVLQFAELVNKSPTEALLWMQLAATADSAEEWLGACTLLGHGAEVSPKLAQAAQKAAASAGFLLASQKPSASSRALILALDDVLQFVPWESLPQMKGRAICRVPGLAFLCQNNRGARQVDLTNGAFVINPSKDLSGTQATFEEDSTFGRLCAELGWGGVMGRAPTSEEYRRCLCESSLFLFCGHNGGEAYFSASEMDTLDRCAVTLLMGCSSGKLVPAGDYDAQGSVLSYLYAGSPAVVANLWDVTDKDIDRLCLDLLRRFVDSPSNTSLLDCLAAARETTNLRFLNGAAPVCYGLPVYKK